MVCLHGQKTKWKSWKAMERSKKARVRKSVSYILVLVFPAPLLEKKEWERRGKSFSPGILVSLGEEEERRGVEKWRGSSARGWSGSAKIIGFLEGCRHHAVYLSVEMAATFFLFFFFFFFFGYRETCNFGTCSSAERFEFLHFSVSRSKLSYFQRSVKFFFFF